MSFAVRRAFAFTLPFVMLPAAAHAGPSVGTVTSSNGALVARDGKVMPAVANMPLFQGDKLMTRSDGSATVALGDRSVHLDSSSMVPMGAHPAILTMNSSPSLQGGDRFRQEFLRRLAEFRRFIHDFRCHPGFPHVQPIGWDGGHDWDNDGHDHDQGQDHDHDHDHDHCPPVSP